MSGTIQDLIRSEMASVIADIESDIIESILAQYRGGKLTNERLHASVGEIAGLRRLVSRLDADARRSHVNDPNRLEDGAEPPHGT